MRAPVAWESEAEPSPPRRGLLGFSLATLLKNAFVLFVVVGSVVAVETGYFSNDRTSRTEWDELERLKAKSKAVKAYETRFERNVLDGKREPEGFWGFYNEASGDTAKVVKGALELTYTEPWIGTVFWHTGFAPSRPYRVVFEAKVEGQPAAILMRNRQLDLMREQIPVTDGEFKEHTYYYVAPSGRFDQVRLIFMPDERRSVKGRMIVKSFRIEHLGD